MKWYDVYREDGSVVRVQAASKSEASRQVRYAGELIKKVVEVEETTPTATTTPPTTTTTTERPFDPRRETAPTTTTPTPSTLPITGGTFSYEALQYGLTDCQRWGGCQGMTVEEYAKSIGATIEKGTGEQQVEFDEYTAALQSGLYPNLPKITDIDEYWRLRNQIVANEEYYFSTIKASLAQADDWIRYQAFGSKYATLDDYSAANFVDFINNYDQAMRQLDAWVTRAGPEATGFTDDEIRRFKDYQQWYYEYGKPGDWMPVDVGDLLTNQEMANQQLALWQQQAGEVDEYALDPAEAVRRREESYKEGRYAAEERYREPARLSGAWTGWFDEQKRWSGALKEYIEDEYPSLRATWEAGQPRPVGYPTREEARAEAARREKSFGAWLPTQMPEVYQEYKSQRPAERGERLWMQQPTMREVNF